MRLRLSLTIAATMVAAAMLIPAAANATVRKDPLCWGSTLGPGKSCTSWPLHVNAIAAHWKVTKAGSGRVCVGVTKWPASPQPVAGAPGLNCGGVGGGYPHPPNRTNAKVGDQGLGGWQIYRYNPYLTYSYAYGQARILNYSSATIKIQPTDLSYVYHND